MGCDVVRGKDGTLWTICCRGVRPKKAKPCVTCGKPSTRLCDFPLAGRKAGKTCDRPLCDGCRRPWPAGAAVQPVEAATLHRDEFDLCAAHATILGGAP